MTEETPKKKPRKKRRTKAQIEAEKAAEAAKQSALIAESEAAEAAKEKEIELEFGSSYEKEIDEVLEQDCGVHLEEEARATAAEALSTYIPKTGLAKLRDKIAQRKLKDRSRNARTKPASN